MSTEVISMKDQRLTTISMYICQEVFESGYAKSRTWFAASIAIINLFIILRVSISINKDMRIFIMYR